MAKEKLIGEAAPEQIAEWKKKYKEGIYAIPVGGHIGYFRNPTRSDLNIATSQLDTDNLTDITETVIRETMIGGSGAILEEDNLYFGASKQIQKKLDGAKSKLVNL